MSINPKPAPSPGGSGTSYNGDGGPGDYFCLSLSCHGSAESPCAVGAFWEGESGSRGLRVFWKDVSVISVSYQCHINVISMSNSLC